MTEAGPFRAPPASPPEAPDPRHGPVAALRGRGAARFDPVGLRFIEALARRAAGHQGEARRALDDRLARALAEYGERFDRAEQAARDTVLRGSTRFPERTEELRRHLDAGDFRGLDRLLAGLEAQGGQGAPGTPLSELLAHIARHAPESPAGRPAAAGAPAAPPGELKSLSYFRSTWSKLSLDRQLSQAFAQAPENAGPLNSHFLVLQSLRLMRDIAPAYLEQFISYADALLWLDQADNSRSGPAQKNAARGERDKKRKPGRGKAA